MVYWCYFQVFFIVPIKINEQGESRRCFFLSVLFLYFIPLYFIMKLLKWLQKFKSCERLKSENVKVLSLYFPQFAPLTVPSFSWNFQIRKQLKPNNFGCINWCRHLLPRTMTNPLLRKGKDAIIEMALTLSFPSVVVNRKKQKIFPVFSSLSLYCCFVLSPGTSYFQATLFRQERPHPQPQDWHGPCHPLWWLAHYEHLNYFWGPGLLSDQPYQGDYQDNLNYSRYSDLRNGLPLCLIRNYSQLAASCIACL